MANSVFFPRRILLGITGGIAAYKTPILVREFIRAGAEVKVIMTESAADFVTPVSLATVSKGPVYRSFVDDKQSGEWTNHVELAEWADLMLIAPATANTVSKFATGRSNDLLTATFLSAHCPIFMAPAMDLEMYKNQSTQDNIRVLTERGVNMIGPESGELASGLVGKGRMTEPAEIVNQLVNQVLADSFWRGKRVLVTAGGTREALDPVRFIGNRSTGTMGIELAKEATWRGAHVDLVLGAVLNRPNTLGMDLHDAESAALMAETCKALFSKADVVIKAAAVADYRPKTVAVEKIKKGKGDLSTIELERTEDILAWMGQNRKESQLLVGFALESEKGMDYAQGKLERKNVDMIVLNSLKDDGAGFGTTTNQVTLLTKNKDPQPFPLMSKTELAKQLIDRLETEL